MILGAVTVVLVALAIVTKNTDLWAVAIVVPIALAVWYLFGYSRRAGPPTPGPVREEEPFDDPVEEADRAASEIAAKHERDDEAEEEEQLSTRSPVPDPGEDADL